MADAKNLLMSTKELTAMMNQVQEFGTKLLSLSQKREEKWEKENEDQKVIRNMLSLLQREISAMDDPVFPHSVEDVALWFLQQNVALQRSESEPAEPLSASKLACLLYLAQGGCLARHNTPLFQAKIYKAGSKDILIPDLELFFATLNDTDSGKKSYEGGETYSDEEDGTLWEVMEKWGCYTGWKLRKILYTDLISLQNGEEITLESMRRNSINRFLDEYPG